MTPSLSPRSTAAICAAGALSLVVAMGIGRFAFTPLLPLMVRDGQLDLTGGAWLAAANYLGYLIGAATASTALGLLARSPLRVVQASLVATVVLTAGMAATGHFGLWLLLRLLAGICSAWVLVGVSSWSLGELAQRGRTGLAAWVFVGVGLGIALAGIHAWIAAAHGVRAASLWLQFGALACVPTVIAGWLMRGASGNTTAAPRTAVTASRPSAALPGGWSLVLCYGFSGFGYILPATFLPALARTVVDDPRLFGLAWPALGLAAAASMPLVTWWLRHMRRLRVWALCHLLLALGAALPVWSHSGAAIGIAALAVGGTFVAVTMVGLQEIRARADAAGRGDATVWVGRMTAAFAVGQIAGPVSSVLLASSVPGPSGLHLALDLAAVVLCASALWLWLLPAGREIRPART
jgi:MFS family permease